MTNHRSEYHGRHRRRDDTDTLPLRAIRWLDERYRTVPGYRTTPPRDPHSDFLFTHHHQPMHKRRKR